MNTTIVLEKFTDKDFHYYYQLVSDAKVMQMITERALTEDEAQADYTRIIYNNQLHSNLGSFKVIDNLTQDFIGFAKLEVQAKEDSQAELGYMLCPQYWGKRIGDTIGRRLIELAKMQPQLQRLFAIIDPNNIPSRKILTNHGFLSKELKDFDGLPGEILELDLHVHPDRLL